MNQNQTLIKNCILGEFFSNIFQFVHELRGERIDLSDMGLCVSFHLATDGKQVVGTAHNLLLHSCNVLLYSFDRNAYRIKGRVLRILIFDDIRQADSVYSYVLSYRFELF